MESGVFSMFYLILSYPPAVFSTDTCINGGLFNFKYDKIDVSALHIVEELMLQLRTLPRLSYCLLWQAAGPLSVDIPDGSCYPSACGGCQLVQANQIEGPPYWLGYWLSS
jgi:hypothetical protein